MANHPAYEPPSQSHTTNELSLVSSQRALRPFGKALFSLGFVCLLPALLFSVPVVCASVIELSQHSHPLTLRQQWLLSLCGSVVACSLCSIGITSVLGRLGMYLSGSGAILSTAICDSYNRTELQMMYGNCGLAATAAMTLQVVFYSIYLGIPLQCLAGLIGTRNR